MSPTETIPRLSGVTGRVIRPNDPDYDRARSSFYGGFDRRPAAIVRVADANDVARVIALARESGMPFAVRSGGHGVAGYGLPDGGLVLDLADMRSLVIDAQAHTAWAETGLTAAAYSTAADAHGLATGFGDTGSVGIGGITLGGGVGYLVRKHGLTIDDLLAADVVTADGQLLRVDAESHPDLFWAIRGGGGNFGVATRLQFRLHAVGTIVGGMMMLPATPDVIHSFIALAEAAPVDATAFAHRKSRIMVNVAALYERPDQAAEYEPWVTGFASALKQGDSGAYVNFLVDEGEVRIRDAYPGKTWDRLRSIKRRYDPTNLFRLNQNIPPASNAPG